MSEDRRRLWELQLIVSCKVSASYRGSAMKASESQNTGWKLASLEPSTNGVRGLMCSNVRAEKTSRATALNITDCNGRSWVSDTPARVLRCSSRPYRPLSLNQARSVRHDVISNGAHYGPSQCRQTSFDDAYTHGDPDIQRDPNVTHSGYTIHNCASNRPGIWCW